ncbi:TetR/AcrR family transcriptional regulator [Kitasatospora sp. MAP5-34]|uniref:TetR/AcrR family transcriptional regulator n=1 Tax=Kitasatospora sp. MAP5-34 TaxID=3035102 RepID=UPI002474A461|nr:TetR/AcrR family transcriptional regulator [Kitasatospora sp. MAP5-34]MDH6575464.1 AcrR family transcriptional regulator [Kitasatospora sp. MAP5-34]
MSAPSLRARVRSEMTEEIKAVARRRLAADGANLSLRGVARDMGVVASALYRYFPSRDDLLTALITEAYEALATAAREADARVPRTDTRGRWLAVGHAVREWALAHPAEYGLLYGSPVPGYAAPQDTGAPATAVVFLLVGAAAEAAQERPGALPQSAPLPEAVRADLRRLIDQQPGEIPEELLGRVFAGWVHLFGLVSFEVFGRMEATIEARREYFEHQMGLMADLAGLPSGAH